jgi:very-short-patch-repair endonuclease
MAKPPVRKTRSDPALLFSRDEARRAGISVRELCGPSYQRLFYNVYVSSTVPVTPLLRARGALKVSPADSYVSHHTAGEIWDGWLPDHDSTHVSSPSEESRCQRRGIRNHDVKARARTVSWHGVRVTDPAQTFIDLATELHLVDLVVFGDSLVRAKRVTPELLIERADAWTGKGRRLARRAARLVREGVDSPMESRLRMLIVLAGLPEPKVNLVLRHADGSWWMRFDLCYPELKLIVEYDGRQHAEDDAQWDRDLERREDLDRLGWRLLVVRSKGVFVQPESTLRRVAGALRERGCPSVPRRFKEEWRRYFPGRPERHR